MADLTPQEQSVAEKSLHSDSLALDNVFADLDAPELVSPEPAPEPDKVAEPEPEPPKLKEAEVTPEPTKRENETDEEFQKRIDGIQIKSSAHPNTKQAFETIKAELKETRDSARAAQKKSEEAEKKFNDLETEYKGKILTPEIEAELNELRNQRREFHIEQDPEFQAKYLGKLKEIDSKAIGILVGANLPPAMEKFIRDNNGVIGMYSSGKQMPEGKYGQYTHRQFIEDVLMPRMPEIERARLQNAIVAGIDLRDEMNKEIEHAKTHGSELQKQRQADIEKRFQDSVRATRIKLGKVAEKWEYPTDATPDQKKAIDKHNERQANSEKLFEDFVKNGKNPERVAEALVLAAQSQYLLEANQELDEESKSKDAKIAELEGKIARMKKSGEHGRQSSAPPPTTAPKPIGKVSDDDAFNQEFGPNAR